MNKKKEEKKYPSVRSYFIPMLASGPAAPVAPDVSSNQTVNQNSANVIELQNRTSPENESSASSSGSKASDSSSTDDNPKSNNKNRSNLIVSKKEAKCVRCMYINYSKNWRFLFIIIFV